MQIDTQTILFGSDSTANITAVEAHDNKACFYVRDGDKVDCKTDSFSPWLLLQDIVELPVSNQISELDGDGYKYKVVFDCWRDFETARKYLRESSIDNFAYISHAKQYLISSGKTLFINMLMKDIYRMQVDIETIGTPFRPDPGQIILIAISDNHGFETVLDDSEPAMLNQLIQIVKERNPDVIEGHNIFNFDLPFIAKRAQFNNIKMRLGRDNSEMTFGSNRSFAIGGFSRPFTPAFIYGRHVIDTLLAVQRFDVAKGELERYGLKEVAKAFGFAEPERVYIAGYEIEKYWRNQPELLKTYALHDVKETRSLAELVCPSIFYMTQMVPDTYQSASTSGNGEKINSILVREYLRNNHAIPITKTGRPVPGGFTDIRQSGLIRNVVKCDVESLYPSLMACMEIKPESDKLDVFLPALKELTFRRLQAKARVKVCEEAEKAYWDGLQNAFKILINSFYGYLGATLNFNDFNAAEKITTSGQIIVKQIAEEIELLNGKVIEIDTDGVYFCPPFHIQTEEEEEKLIDIIGSKLPEGIRLAHDGRFSSMLSLKIKNYLLVDYAGRKIFKGSSLRNRADEKFGRKFISEAVDLLLADKPMEAAQLYKDTAEKIANGKMPLEDFARRERITAKTFSSTQKKRQAAAATGAKVGEYIRVYEKNNREIGLAENYANDEDRNYYIEKLYKFASRLKPAFGDDFDILFPSPKIIAKQKSDASIGQFKLDF